MQQVDKLIQTVADSALRAYEGGKSDPATIEALASLINAAHGEPPVDGSPCIGFIVPSPPEDEE
ncbi:hypothetical protein [Paenibacillus pinistramenti]|uniref:hypothetical protein n=1 Tax=Paenibacillus pinistramenti TaxID=1768003 RepID=UPI001396BBE8|nr:hypothetical protein [Paenibacillus pinistramenti]